MCMISMHVYEIFFTPWIWFFIFFFQKISDWIPPGLEFHKYNYFMESRISPYFLLRKKKKTERKRSKPCTCSEKYFMFMLWKSCTYCDCGKILGRMRRLSYRKISNYPSKKRWIFRGGGFLFITGGFSSIQEHKYNKVFDCKSER